MNQHVVRDIMLVEGPRRVHPVDLHPASPRAWVVVGHGLNWHEEVGLDIRRDPPIRVDPERPASQSPELPPSPADLVRLEVDALVNGADLRPQQL